MGYSGAGGKLIHEKNQKQKSHDTAPLMTMPSYGRIHRHVAVLRGAWPPDIHLSILSICVKTLDRRQMTETYLLYIIC